MRRRANGNTESVDNYLKAILALGGAEDSGVRVASKALAERLGVAPASVTNMLQKLAGAALPLVVYERHRGVQLSAEGRRRALEVLRHHRLLETFLYEVLDYPLDEVHDEAERLEHFISERFEERIAAKLGHPRNDPHGHSIPAMDGTLEDGGSIPLTDVAADGAFVICSVSDRDRSRLKGLEACGLTPGARLQVRPKGAEAGYAISVERAQEIELSRAEAGEVQVVPALDGACG